MYVIKRIDNNYISEAYKILKCVVYLTTTGTEHRTHLSCTSKAL